MSVNSITMQKLFTPHWSIISALLFLLHLIIGLVAVMLLNGSMVNHALTPIFQYLGIFQLIWPEQPMGALQFLATKSLLAFAHQDSRSGLNLWTLEYDTITLFIFALLSLTLGRILARSRASNTNKQPSVIAIGIIGTFFIAFSVSYMTDIEHCSGATWVGFVAMYGLGFDEFELFPFYQWICAVIGIIALGSSLILTRRGQP